MSYIIAFVSFEESKNEFPVQCFRTDIKLGDSVIVRRGDGKLRYASVQNLEYLNWDCNGRIECKMDEASQNSDGQLILPKGTPIANGLSSSDAFIKELKSHGWVPIKSRRKQYRAVFGYANQSRTAYIFVRKNGIDIQMLPRTDVEELKPYTLHEISFGEGTVVQHFLAHTTFNLFEGLLRFSKSFINNEENLDRYFKPQGSRDKRNEALRKQGEARDAERRRLNPAYS
ncbi:hypothetical protein [Marinobacter fuscus]|uniref:hypothetical protein n=1 Tax=Marinobacter fuscus TaxID=2109942 RepID=UPI001981E95A|nr:hypothetical protein [Marinobacter fuscus]